MVRQLTITKQDVENAATLSRLKLSETDTENYTEQLKRILNYAEQLNELDIEGVEPTYHVVPLTNVMREDIVGTSIDRDKVLMNVQETQKGCFKVPRIIE